MEIIGLFVLILAVTIVIWNPYRKDAEIETYVDEWKRSEKLYETMGFHRHSRLALDRLLRW